MPPKTKPDSLPADSGLTTSQPAATEPPPVPPPALGITADQGAPTAPPLAAAEPDPVPAAPEGVTLTISHPVKHDGTQYGPGDVTVTADVAEIFRALGIVAE